MRVRTAAVVMVTDVFGTCNVKFVLSGLLIQYRSLVERGELQHDSFQERVASELESLLGRLEQYEKDMEEYHVLIGIDNTIMIRMSYMLLFLQIG